MTEGLTSGRRKAPGMAGKGAYQEQMCLEWATAAPYTLPALDHFASICLFASPCFAQTWQDTGGGDSRASRLRGSHGRPRTTMDLMWECPSCQLWGSSCPPGPDMRLLSGLWGRVFPRALVLGAPRGAQQWEQLP